MGGLLDSTNVCPLFLTGITTIGLDHVFLLEVILWKPSQGRKLEHYQARSSSLINEEHCPRKPWRLLTELQQLLGLFTEEIKSVIKESVGTGRSLLTIQAHLDR